MSGTAILSADLRYRYTLGRQWGHGPTDVWIMLNPSTADADADDPTIRRCIGFSRGWGAGGLTVVNLFALRSTDPRGLAVADDPVGPDNDDHIRDAVDAADDEGGRVVAAWGAHRLTRTRGPAVERLVEQARNGRSWVTPGLLRLGTTRDGSPRHPLYVRGDAEPLPWVAL